MLTLADISKYEITTPLAKSGATTARTFQAGENLNPASAYVYQGTLGVICKATTKGAATSSVHRTRTEMKGEPFKLKDAQLHRSFLELLVHTINYDGEAVYQQMHCDDGNDPTLKLFMVTKDGKKGTVKAGLRTSKSSKDPAKVTIFDGIDLASLWTSEILVTADGLVTINISQGGTTKTLEKQLETTRAKRPHVWHWGPYNQVDMGGKGEPQDDATVMELVTLVDYHGDAKAKPQEPEEVATGTPEGRRIDASIDAVVSDWKAGKIAPYDALGRLNVLSKDTGQLATSEERAPFYTRIRSAKAAIQGG